MSELFWETMHRFLHSRKHLLMGKINEDFIRRRVPLDIEAIERICTALMSCIGFIDGTELGIYRPID